MRHAADGSCRIYLKKKKRTAYSAVLFFKILRNALWFSFAVWNIHVKMKIKQIKIEIHQLYWPIGAEGRNYAFAP